MEEVVYWLFNFIGGSIRWGIHRISNSNPYGRRLSFKEYLHGPDNSEEFVDEDEDLNTVIGGIVLIGSVVIILVLIIK